MTRIIVVLLAAVFLLTSCGDKLQGTVSSKEFEDGYTTVMLIPVVVGKSTVLIPTTYYIPPCYKIHVQGEVSGDSCVAQSQWDELEVGDAYEGPDVDPEDRKIEQ